jgi:hypothetical protein
MVILVLLSPFFIAIAWVLYLDSTNIEMIEEFYKKNSCVSIYNYKSRYKGLCEDKIIIVNNQFNIDFSQNLNIKYEDIKNIKLESKEILLDELNSKERLYFKEEIDSKNFYEELSKRIK